MSKAVAERRDINGSSAPARSFERATPNTMKVRGYICLNMKLPEQQPAPNPFSSPPHRQSDQHKLFRVQRGELRFEFHHCQRSSAKYIIVVT